MDLAELFTALNAEELEPNSSWVSDREVVSTFVPPVQVLVFFDMTICIEDMVEWISWRGVNFLSARRECTDFKAHRCLRLSLCLKAGNFSKPVQGAGEWTHELRPSAPSYRVFPA